MDFIDYYKTLGINKKATANDVKKAYRKLARKYHPDLNPNDKDAELNFKKINEANEVLSNPEYRKKYDKYGKDWENAEAYEKAARTQNNNRQRTNNQNFSDNDFSDYFESMFGGQGAYKSRSVKFKGQDFNSELTIDLLNAAKTHKKTLTVNGKNIRITIPAGIEHGQTIKIKGHGGPGANAGPKGDLYITFKINNNTNFKRDKNNLYLDVPIDLYTAVLGGEITVNTLDGKVKLNVKPETQNGDKVKLKGKGFPFYKNEGTNGDLFITYTVQLPKNLTTKQKDLFTKLSKL